MSQQLHIILDGGELPMSLFPPGADPATTIVRLDSSEVELVMLAGGMESGAHSIALFARLPDGKLGMIEMSSNNFLNAAAAVRGRLIRDGIIRERLDPQIAFSADKAKRTVHFSAETPLHSWEYSLPHAKAFWRQLRQMTEGL